VMRSDVQLTEISVVASAELLTINPN
jgi:hypothetical protein